MIEINKTYNQIKYSLRIIMQACVKLNKYLCDVKLSKHLIFWISHAIMCQNKE